MTSKGEICIVLKNNLSELERLSRALEEFEESHRLPLKIILDVNLALDEIFTNIVSYGYKDKDEHLIKIYLSFDEKELSIKVEDDGFPYNPLEAPEPDLNLSLDERNTGGLGIHFVRNMVKDLKYERQRGENVLMMKKKLN